MEPDNETKEILSDADHVRSMLDSKGWAYAKGKLDALILDLQNIYNLDMTDPTSINIQLASRKMAVETIMAWLKAHVYGFVEQQEMNSSKQAQTEENFISRE